MNSRTSKHLARYSLLAALISFASYGNAGTAAVTPALAACSKALVESIAKAEPLPVYKVKAPSRIVSDMVDPHAFTVYATSVKTNRLLAKAACKATPAGEIVTFRSLPVKS